MGNSSSHSVQLAQTRLSFHSAEKQKAKKYACAVNRVLPSPMVGQRLRITDNGSILHSGGTISKRKHGRHESESNFSKLLQNSIDTKMVYGHRKSYSDPDVIRLMMTSSKEQDYETEQEANKRSIIAMSPSKAKIKSKKRTHAPEPPQSNVLSNDVNRLPSRCGSYTSIFQKKNNAVFLPSVQHPEDCVMGAINDTAAIFSDYDVSKWPIDKRKTSKYAENYPATKESQQPVAAEGVDKIFRKAGNTHQENKELRTNDLKEAIISACKKKNTLLKNYGNKNENNEKNERKSINNNLKRYYFDDVECFKISTEKYCMETKQKFSRKPENIPKTTIPYASVKPSLSEKNEVSHSYQREQLDLNDRKKIFSRCNNTSQIAENSPSSSLSEEEDVAIDIQLRPTLPKRQLEIARFSPSEVWKSIVVDLRSQHIYDLSSDEGDMLEDTIEKIDKPVAPKRFITDRCEYSAITRDPRSFHKREDEVNGVVPVSFKSNLAWVPQQDLDDSDGEDTPNKLHNLPQVMNVQAKFTLPNSMFPGQKCKEQEECNKGNEKSSQGKKADKSNDHFSSLRNIKKALGFRGKPSIDEQKCLDTNWSLSRSLPDFINHLHLTEKSSNRLPIGSSEIKADSVRQNSSLSTPLLSAKKEERIKENSLQYSTQCHVMYLPEYIIADSEKYEIRKKTFTYQSTVRKVERKMLEAKLAKEIEERENQRRKEKEWMEQVENEFRKQREKEKAFKCSNKLSFGEPTNYSENEDTRWKHQTGMSKWLRYGRQQLEIRPEPEGSRSSVDENQSEQKRKQNKDNRVNQNFAATDSCCQAEKINGLVKEKFDIHAEIQRTDSGQTFESHSYCMIKQHGELNEGLKSEEIQTAEAVKSKIFCSEQNLAKNGRKNVKIQESHLSKKRSSLDDFETLSEDDYADNFDQKKRHSSGKRWKEAVITNKVNSSLDKTLESTIGFLRNHPLRNGARLKTSANYAYQAKSRSHTEQIGQCSISIQKQNGYSENRWNNNYFST